MDISAFQAKWASKWASDFRGVGAVVFCLGLLWVVMGVWWLVVALLLFVYCGCFKRFGYGLRIIVMGMSVTVTEL